MLHSSLGVTCTQNPNSKENAPGRQAWFFDVRISDAQNGHSVDNGNRHSNQQLQQVSSSWYILSPIQRLPAEVLAEVFLHVPHDGRPNPKLAPLLLCQICTLWREVTLGTPGLWDSVDILFNRSRLRAPLDLAKMWLDRSQTSSISVHLSTVPYFIPHNPIIDIIGQHSSRLRVLSVKLPISFIYALLNLPYSMESLESLEVEVTSRVCDITLQPPKLRRVFDLAPRLRTLTVSNWDTLQCYMLWFPWSQLIQLYIAHIPLQSHLIRCLAQCTSLLYCTLSFDVDGGDERNIPLEPNGLAVLPNLLEFHLTCSELDMSRVFRALTLPALEVLDISSPDCSWPQEAFLSFQSWSSFNLLTLSLDQAGVTSEELATILANMPSLVKLKVSQSDCVDTRLFEKLSYMDGSTHILVPQLKHLEMSLSSRYELAHSTIAKMLESRWQINGDHNVDPRRLECFSLKRGGEEWHLNF